LQLSNGSAHAAGSWFPAAGHTGLGAWPLTQTIAVWSLVIGHRRFAMVVWSLAISIHFLHFPRFPAGSTMETAQILTDKLLNDAAAAFRCPKKSKKGSAARSPSHHIVHSNSHNSASAK